MKLSLAWIQDHILGGIPLNPSALAELLSSRTAEIDGIEMIHIDISRWYMVRVENIDSESLEVYCPELDEHYKMAYRTDATLGSFFFIIGTDTHFRWTTLSDAGSSKEGLFCSVFVPNDQLKGAWRDSFETRDCILVIDNKALTNRPDLWGHRGFAREIAALLSLPLRPEEELLRPLDSIAGEPGSCTVSSAELSVERTGTLGEERPCRSLAALLLTKVENRASSSAMALRLARVDIRPLGALIDMTNYVLADLGQPMHAFDAAYVADKKLIGRFAEEGECIALLDDTEVSLHTTDYVIADTKEALSVAGIMGGRSSMVNPGTTSLILEAGSFNPTMIRRTATALKKRTESAARFEKNLDPVQTSKALMRYLSLMNDEQISYELGSPLLVSADPSVERVIVLPHTDAESKIGLSLSVEQVKSLLESLGFTVLVSQDKETSYTVTVPSWRATRDITIKEDLIEEIARLIGYEAIVPCFPTREMRSFDMSSIERLRMIKKFMAFGLGMREIQSYAFFDESFLQTINYNPQDTLKIANPLSENWQRLVTSLAPHLFQAVRDNRFSQESFRFFEIQRVWFFSNGPVEEYECAGMWHEKKKALSFYEGKDLLTRFFHMLKLEVEWRKPLSTLDPWYDTNQSAELWHNDRILGTAGKVDFTFLREISEGEAFVFELDMNALLSLSSHPLSYKPLAKYPGTDFDSSVLIGVEHTVASLEKIIKQVDARIVSVLLVDSFERPEWAGKKSLTFRCTVQDPQGTLSKATIEEIRNGVRAALEKTGGEIR